MADWRESKAVENIYLWWTQEKDRSNEETVLCQNLLERIHRITVEVIYQVTDRYCLMETKESTQVEMMVGTVEMTGPHYTQRSYLKANVENQIQKY